MIWRIEVDSQARKDLKKLGKTAEKRVIRFLAHKLDRNNPRNMGESLKGSVLGHIWRYRVGDYRVLCELRDNELLVLVVEAGHRKEIYRKNR